MTDLFNPYVDKTIRDSRVVVTHDKRVIDDQLITDQTATDYLAEPVSLRKMYLLGLLFGVGLCILLGRVFYLQILQGTNYNQLAHNNSIHTTYLSAARGIIYDSQHQALVQNVPDFIVTITPSNLPSDAVVQQTVLSKTASVLQLPLDQLTQQVTTQAQSPKLYHQPLTLKDFVPYDQALALTTKLSELPGVEVSVQSSRQYTHAQTFSHILGYLSKVQADDIQNDNPHSYLLTDMLGRQGVEAYYQDELRGRHGEQQIQVNASGAPIKVVSKQAPVAGDNLVLSIDQRLQDLLYQGLQKTTDSNHLTGGAAVAIDPRTGEIKALVSYPGYDDNVFTTGINQTTYNNLLNDPRKPLFNKTISGMYPPGSTFKLVIAAAALQEHVITPTTTINSTGGVHVNQAFFRDWKSGGHGITDVRKALAQSVNTFFYLAGGGTYDPKTNTISGGLGIDRIDHYANLFGLGNTTGIDLGGEAPGFIPSPAWKEKTQGEQWYIGDTYHVSIGQGDVLTTPLQVALYTAVVANGGTLYQPTILKQITDSTGKIISTTQPKVLQSNFVDAANLQVVRQGMQQAVQSGSARGLLSLPFTAGAKTGTAQTTSADTTHTDAWFTMFAPYDNPQLVISAVVEKGGGGESVTLPIVRDAIKQYVAEQPFQ